MLSDDISDYLLPSELCVTDPKLLRSFSDLPEKQGLLFSDDEIKMDVDADKTGGLVAAAKITLFEVEGLLRSLVSHCVATLTPSVASLPLSQGAGSPPGAGVPPRGSDEGAENHRVV